LTDAKLTESQTRTVLAVLSFIMQNAVGFDVEPEDLAQELQQLSAPLSHTSIIIRFHRENRRPLHKFFQRISESPVFEYPSDLILRGRNCDGLPQGTLPGRVLLRFRPKNSDLITVGLTARQTEDLARELRVALEVMGSGLHLSVCDQDLYPLAFVREPIAFRLPRN
jgi:hypothetical protein